MEKSKGQETMSIQAILIDAENVSSTLAPLIMAEAKKRGATTQSYVYGCKKALQGWQAAIVNYAMQVRTHEGGKNAADHLLLQDAHTLFEQQGVRNFCLVSNDGGFAPHVHLLCVAGCEVTIIGNDHAAKQLKKAGTCFVPISKKMGKQLPISRAEREKGSLGMSTLHPCNEAASHLGDDAGHEEPDACTRKITALHDLYGPTYPDYLFTMLNLVLEQCFRDLSLEGKNVFVDVQREPQEVEELLKDLQSDPVFEEILAEEKRAQQWQHLLLFARRCHRACQQGWEAAKTPFAILPMVDARSPMFEQRRLKDGERWRPYPTYEQRDIYPSAYSEDTELGILRRWYQQGYAAQMRELAINLHAAWIPFEEVTIGDEE